ncbi:hypothetical protein [Selenomonas sp. AE3005]|uniref:hypothetical protein n=1 Tax=Selenomonas sp. AE3005 TaxID=1485543 RepID=UPI0025F28D9A|nr:hypothetical protein [Selenomonas sp. AE3005]
MKNKVPYRIAKVMHDLQEYCGYEWDESEGMPCQKCPAGLTGVCDLFVACHGIPKMWGLTRADIEQLERAEDE